MKLGAAHRVDRRGDGERGRGVGGVERLSVPGYRVLGRLDGPGEVWGAEGPGGFRAALRVLRPGPAVAPEALQAVVSGRRARHPNIQAAFGSWRVGPALVVALELPDGSLWDRYREAGAAGLPGVPRDELIEALAEAARGVDYLNASADAVRPPALPGPGLPHGDIAPRTILYVGGGVKVADVDPARWLSPASPPGPPLDPLYAAPERLAGRPSRHSDQYSLALTYCHLRTGLLAAPADLAALPASERRAVARALEAAPERRWPSCRAFLDALRADVRAAELSPGPAPVVAEGVPGDVDPVAPPALGRTAVLSLAAAAGAAALAAALWVRSAGVASVGRPDRSRADRLAGASPGGPAVPLAAGTPAPPVRVRLQDPGDESPEPPLRAETGPEPSARTAGRR
jgi:hypothetical protein